MLRLSGCQKAVTVNALIAPFLLLQDATFHGDGEIIDEGRLLVSEGVKRVPNYSPELTYYGVDLLYKSQKLPELCQNRQCFGRMDTLHYAYPATGRIIPCYARTR